MNKKLSTLALALLVTSGCATVKEGFIGDEREDLTPFADATVQLMTLDQIGLRRSELVFLRAHYDENEEALTRLGEILGRVDNYRDDISDYSLELVRISQFHPTDDAKCRALGDLVEVQADDPFLEDSAISAAEFRAAAADLRAGTDFLACLRMIQPLVVRSGEAFEDMIKEAEEILVPQMVARLDASIDREFGTAARQLDIIYERRDELFRGLQAIRAYRKGDKDALRGFNTSGAVSDPAYHLPVSPSDAQLERTKDHIIMQLHKEETILAFLAGDRDDYIATVAELEREEKEILESLDLALRQVVAWVRAHEALANGVRDPGKWLSGLAEVVGAYKKAT